MGLPGHRRTSSHKRRRASHFALKAATLSVDPKTGSVHLPHRPAPLATEYRGIPLHFKGRDRKLAKMIAKTKAHLDEHGHGHAHDNSAASTQAEEGSKA